MSQGRSCNVFVFGDLAFPFEQDLRQLLHLKSNPSLEAFIIHATAALRVELGSLPIEQRSWSPSFTTLTDLVDNFEPSTASPAIRSALLTLCQLGRFIRYCSDGGNTYPTTESTCLVGLCTGSFAAAAVSASSTVAELIPAGIEAVLSSFRTGLCSLVQGLDVQGTTDTSMSWSITTATREDEACSVIAQFCATRAVPPPSKPYISSVSPSGTTISGEPDLLQQLITTSALKSYALNIHSPYHAPHLHAVEGISDIIRPHHDPRLKDYESKLPILSPVTGALMQPGSFRELLATAARHALYDQLRLDKIVSSLSEGVLDQYSSNGFMVLPVMSSAGQVIASALRKSNGPLVVVEDLMTRPLHHSSGSSGRLSDSKIAIVGFSGRFPDANSNEEFWDLLRDGRDVHREIPEDRFDWKAHFDPSGKRKNTSRIKHGCFIRQPGLMDARFFNISPREAENADPAQRLALMSTYEALEMAGFVPNRTPSTQTDRVGVFFGITSDDWREVNSGQDIDTYFIPGGNRAFLPGRISYFFRFSGPSISMDTACSSSFAAIQTACSYLWSGECDTAVAGGANVLTNPDNFAGLDRGHFLSPTGNCNAFDDGANGYCRADAVGSVILKRLEDAEADNDPIFAVIAGSNTNHCGQTDSITRPFEGDQVAVFRNILRHANMDPRSVSYIEMHGTGTQAGDATEMSSVLSVFDPRQDRTSEQPLFLGSAKANIGHAEAASGVSSLIKVLMMMQNNEIPPHCGIKTKINHNYPLNLEERHIHIAREPTAWVPRGSDGSRTVFLNNFSAAGGNTAILLQDAPKHVNVLSESPDSRATYPVTVSAKSRESLKSNVRGLISFLDRNPETLLPALSYTTTARRSHYRFRTCFVVSNVPALQEQLARWLAIEGDTAAPITTKPKSVAWVFTGQGVLYASLGRELYIVVPSFRADLVRYDSLACKLGFSSFLPLIDGSVIAAEDAGTTSIQLALCCVQMALSRLWRSWGVQPSMVIGHSLGEYAALFAAGVLSASDAIFLVGKRADLITSSCTEATHSMLAVKAPLSAIKPRLDFSDVDVACINSPRSTVISGCNAAIKCLKENLKLDGVDSLALEIPFAFHSAQIDPILENFAVAASAVSFKPPKVPYLSPLRGDVVREGGVLNGEYLCEAARGTVDFLAAVRAASEQDLTNEHTMWLEIGSHPVCSRMVQDSIDAPSTTLTSLKKGSSAWSTLHESLNSLYSHGIDVLWSEYQQPFVGSHQMLALPRYSWDLANYWIQYRHNFCLTKGDDPGPTATTVQVTMPYLSSSVHQVIEECAGPQKSNITIQSNLLDPRLRPAIEGHKVNGVALCPSSLYVDMATTIAKRLLEGASGAVSAYGIDCAEMQVEKPLIASTDGNVQHLRATAIADWAKQTVSMSFFSVNERFQKIAEHARCIVRLAPEQDWITSWNRITHLVNGRITALQRGATESSTTHHMKRAMVYKLFSSLVDYDPTYQGIGDVVVDTEELEAAAQVQFQVRDRGFDFDPCWVDSLGHIAGFIMNNQIDKNDTDQVFINHGWSSARFAKAVVPDRTYSTYNKMHLVGNNLFAGDTYILEDGLIIGVIEGVRFQGVPRQILDNLLPKSKASRESTKSAPSLPQTLVSSARPSAEAPRKMRTLDLPTTSKTLPLRESRGPGPKIISSQIAAIIAEEARLGPAELKPDSEFADFGIDSLLSLTISGRLQEELGLVVTSSDFMEYPSLKELTDNLVGVADRLASPASTDPGLTPPSLESLEGSEVEFSLADHEPDLLEALRSAISRETGVPQKELTRSVSLRDIGVDSLLALNVMGTMSEQYSQDWPSTLLFDNDTLGDIENSLDLNGYITKSSRLATDTKSKLDPILNTGPSATSVHLQGSTKTASINLFLFPDGAGSAASYGSIPRISSQVVIYGLNCPWMRTPGEMKCTFEQYVGKFLQEIRRRQPAGPYYFGGWSAGGILAYEAAQQLADAGEEVKHIVLLDSPNPIGLENPPARMYDFFESLDFFGMAGKSPPSWLRPHFDAFLSLLDNYRIMPFRRQEKIAPTPALHIIYAKDGICKRADDPRPEIRPGDPREMLWLLNNRTDFSASGWGDLVGKERVSVTTLAEVNHFTMVANGPHLDKLATFISKALSV